jgi:hypothetical protein
MGAIRIRYQLTKSYFFDTDFTYTYARIDDPGGWNTFHRSALPGQADLAFRMQKGFREE